MKSLYWITGNYYESQKKWHEILSSIPNANVEIFDGDSVSDIILALKMRDIFDTRPRIIKIKSVSSDYDLLTDYLRLANSKSVIVIDSPIGYYKPPSKRLISLKTSKFYKVFAEHGGVFEFQSDFRKNSECVTWLEKILKDQKMSIDPDAVRLLIELKGKNCDTLYSEIIKLANYTTSKKISIDNVKDCCAPLFLRQVWDFIDDLTLMNIDSSLSHLQQFYQVAGLEPSSSFRGDIEMLLGAMLKQFNFYLLINDCGGLNYSRIKTKSSGIKKKTKKIVDGCEIDVWETDYFDPQFININLNKESTKQITKWPWSRIYASVREIHRTRLAIRSNSCISEYNRGGAKVLLDTLAMTICGKITPKQSERMRGRYV